jgi:hypothetical protein
MTTWDSDDSSSNNGEDGRKKGHASIAIQEKISIFDTPSTCFMAKATMVQSNDDSDSSSDDDEPTKDELITMLKD